MGSKPNIDKKDDKPGPGAYESIAKHSRLKSMPAYSMGSG